MAIGCAAGALRASVFVFLYELDVRTSGNDEATYETLAGNDDDDDDSEKCDTDIYFPIGGNTNFEIQGRSTVWLSEFPSQIASTKY